MATYLTPGVYIEEVASGNKPIAGVGTGTGAFIGITQRGPLNKATLVTNWTQFVNTFGIDDNYRLTDAVYDFFNEGGSKCYIVRVVHYTGTSPNLAPDSAPSSVTLEEKATPGNLCMKFAVIEHGTWADGKYSIQVSNTTSGTSFDLSVREGTVEVEKFVGLTNATAPQINSAYITITLMENATIISTDIPGDTTGYVELTNGSNGVDTFTTDDLKGDAALQTGLHALDTVDEVSLIATPDVHSVTTVDDTKIATGINNGFSYCANRKDCFFIAEPGIGISHADVTTWAGNFNSSYGAIYYPWVESANGGMMPPSGMVMGAIARTDSARGVHKAPAGITDGYLRSAMSLEKLVTTGEQDVLNPLGINVIRHISGAGICIWGARTTSADAEWIYLNLRRYFMYVEESIDEGSQWVVFEPNTPNLWGTVKRNITAFLMREWRSGALFGNTAEEAFYVKIDSENNTEGTRALGQLIIEVGIAPVRPAEFVIIRISQKTQG